MRADSGKALSQDELAAVNMRSRRRLLHKEAILVPDTMTPGPSPKLAHRSVVPTQTALGIDRNSVGAARLRMNQEPLCMGTVTENSVVMINSQIAQGLAVIMEKSIANRAAVHNPAG
ncbi:hypothetical protein SDC9_197210 [bioreactor metagenome]|uniref:Uncharacterized protein n=1 Tax=bioreactor metagenome TaxID=1076179 RepID=A0A645IE44_9ZZZZ